ncbi:MAG TPA: hypothetical protein VFN35_07045 [Ktedonobacteraceae bacterium]|nr:hypothetical protein [Ktedonobacteraceae bacterium]
MFFTTLSWKAFSGQSDVQPSLHIPMVYERVPASPMLWEYHVLTVDTREAELPDEAALNELGNAGWLLVNVLEHKISERGSRISYYFVRPKDVEGV